MAAATKREPTVNKTTQFIGDIYIGNLTASAANYSLESSSFVRYIITAATYLLGSLGIGQFTFERRDLK